AAKGEWLALLDSDDHWLPEKLARQLLFHAENPEIMLSQTDEQWVRNDRPVNKAKRFRQKEQGWLFVPSLFMCHVSPSAVLIHRSVFDEVGLFDESLPACEDYDLWLRISRQYPVGLVDEPLIVKTGGHDDQLSCRYWGMDRFRIQAMEKHLDDHPWRQLVLAELARRCEVVALGAQKRGKAALYDEYEKKRRQYRQMLAGADAVDAPGARDIP
ncbi:MAG: glycosyltransferase, partial [Desulfobulbaceae bacterium]|nr:glycosyltransferase [Desulfobulbaceae bacterium]